MNLVVFRKGPYGTVYTGEGIRALSSFAAFEMDVSVLFMDDGVFSLMKDQNPEPLEMKSLGEGFESLSGFGIQEFLVSEESLKERGIEKEELIDVEIQIINNEEIRALMDQCHCILTF